MADAEQDALAQAAAGLDLTRTPASHELTDPSLQGHINTANEVAAIQRAERVAQYTNWDLTKDAFANIPAVTLYTGLRGQGFEDDPTYTWDRWKAKFDTVKDTIPEEYWSQLYGASSDAQFDYLHQRSLDHVQRLQRIGDAGWDGFAASALAQMVDPINWTSWGVSVKALRAMQATQKGWVASHAISGAWANTVVTGLEHASGKVQDTQDYMFAAGMGLVLGGGIGGLSRNPALAHESAALVRIGTDLWKAGVAGAEKVQAKASSMAGIKRAADAAKPEVQKVAPEVQEVAPKGFEALDAEARNAEVQEGGALNYERAGLPKPKGHAVDTALYDLLDDDQLIEAGLKQAKPAEVIDPRFQDAVTTGQPQQLDDTPQLLKNTNYYGRYAAPDGNEYRVYRNNDGEFRVVQQNPEKGGRNITIASGLETASDALKKIPTAEPKAVPMAAISGVPRVPDRASIERVGDAYAYRGFEIHRDPDEVRPGYKHFNAFKDGDHVGEVELELQTDGRWKVSWQHVFPEHRKSYAAAALLKAAEAEGAHVGIPDGTLSVDSFPQFAKRLWWVKEWYRPDPFHSKGDGKGDWVSPKKLLEIRDDLLTKIAAGAKNLNDKLKGVDETIASIPKEAFEPENMAVMFAARPDPRDPFGSVGELRPGTREMLEELLNRIAPASVRIEFADGKALWNGNLGEYYDRVIALALGADNPRNIAYHENTHALRQLKLINDGEWDALVKWANSKSVNARQRYRLEEKYEDYYFHYGVYKGTPSYERLMNEEAVAHALADYMTGVRFGSRIDQVFERIVHILRSLRSALGGKGVYSIHDIAQNIESGAIARREEAVSPSELPMAARDANAADNPIPRQDYLQDPDWKSVQDGDVPKAAGWMRFDPAWFLGKSKNPLTRLLGGFLLDNVVGNQGHALNPFSADLRQAKILDQYTGQFNRFRWGLLQEWAEEMKIGPVEMRVRQSEFYTQTGLYIRGVLSPDEVPASIKKFGDATRKLLSEVREDFNNPRRHEGKEGRPLTRSGDMEQNEKYLSRMFNHEAVRDAIETYGMVGVVKMVAGSIKSAQPDIDPVILQKLAQGYVENIDKQARGLADDWGVSLASGDRRRFAALLRNDLPNLTDQEIDYVISRVMPEGAKSNTGHLKGRVLLDEGYIERGLQVNTNGVPNGETMDLAFHALIENDVTKVLNRYLRRASGWIALAQTRVELPERPGYKTAPDGTTSPHPTPGHVIVDGFTTHDEIDDAIKRLHEYGTDLNVRDPSYTLEMRDKEIEAVRWHFDRILGIPNPKQLTEPAWWMRMLRGIQTMRLLGQVGIAQLGELGTVVGTLGVRAAAGHIPAFKRMITPDGESVLSVDMYRYLETIGIGTERMHGLRHAGWENIEEVPFGTSRVGWKDIAQDTIRVGERATYELSGMSFIQQQQERAAAAWIAQDWANQAIRMKQGKSPDAGWIRRAAQLGMSEQMMQKVFREMTEHADFKEGYLFSHRIESLNADRWKDLEAKAHFENSLYRYVRKLIQKGSQGSVPRFMQEDPLWQTIFQFRTFPFTAYANQLQYGLHMFDHRTFQAFTWSLVWNALVRYAQVQALAVGRADRDKFLEEKLSWKELGAAGFSRSGWASIMPMAFDSALLLTGNREGVFNQRSSAQSSNIVFGSPSLSFFDTATKGVGGLANSAWNMRPPSQGELRNAFNILPFSNMMPIAQGYSYMISGAPEKAPSQRRSPGPLDTPK